MGKRLPFRLPKTKPYGLITFGFALLMAVALFVPFIIANKGLFFYYGDFNVQEIPFYQLVHDSVKAGKLGWSNLTDLGSDLLSSYSFYLLGSPFFWLTIPFDSQAVPYLIGPILILKFGCTALSGYIYLRRYVENKTYAVAGGLLYAFSGYSIYNVFFFHFHEPMIVFPLLLAALDAFLYDKKRVVFAIAVFAACVVNYYFFTGQVLFVVMYYLMLVFTRTYKFRITEFLLLAVEVIIGFVATAFILLPSVLGLMGNPRLDSLPQSWDALAYDRPERYWLILISFLFPADMPAYPVFTPYSSCKWASVAAWLPLVGMTGTIAFLQMKQRDWLKKLIVLLGLFAFVPVLNSAFQMFNSSIYYARWFYMIDLMLVLATLRSLESNEIDWNRAIRWSSGITFGVIVLIGFMPDIDASSGEEEKLKMGIAATEDRFWIYSIMAMMSLLAFVLILKKFSANPKRMAVWTVTGVIIVSMVTSGFIITNGVLVSGTSDTIKKDILNKKSGLQIDDIDEVRSDFYSCVDNTQMFWQIQSINCFQSSVSTSIMQFYEKLGITRDVASRPETNAYGLRPFLSCKYLFDYHLDGEPGSADSFLEKDGTTLMSGWKYLKAANNFDVYENENYIPMGFCFDEYITDKEFDRIMGTYQTEALVYALVIPRETMKKYADITGYTDEKYAELYDKELEGKPKSFLGAADAFAFGYEEFVEQCDERRSMSCSAFEYTDNGFKAKYNNKGKDNLLFFSVPYSDGFTATVNGEPVDVEKVQFGFMAVRVPGNTECDVVFTYETPGFALGSTISLCAAGAFGAYVLIWVVVWIVKRKRAKIRVLISEE